MDGFQRNDKSGVTATGLALRAGVTKQAMGKVVRLLEEQGYVYAQPHEKDARFTVIFLNQRSMELLTCIYHAQNELKRKFAQVIGEEETERLTDTMLQLVEGLEKEGPLKRPLDDWAGTKVGKGCYPFLSGILNFFSALHPTQRQVFFDLSVQLLKALP